jgi:acetyl-CoA C-acetyltransferase
MKPRKLKDVFVVDGCRTPFIKACGRPGPFSASDLAFAAGRSLLARQPFEPDALDEVIIACVIPRPDEANISRIVGLRLGCRLTTPAWTVQRNCASGMQALDSAALNIAVGRSDLVLTGGAEAMSRAPLLLNQYMLNWLSNWRLAHSLVGRLRVLGHFRPHYVKPVIALICGLTDPVIGMSMGQTAEEIAHHFDISRDEMDEFSVMSHQRLANAQDNGYLEEIEVIYDRNGKYYDHDEGLRRDTNSEKIAKMRPVFDRDAGNVTAANSSQITDGSAMLILASRDAVEKYSLPVLGRIVGSRWATLDPAEMGLGPVHAVPPLLEEHKLAPDDIDYWEINEAFAAQVIGCLKAWEDEDYCQTMLGLDHAFGTIAADRLNVDGGAISLGHPVGASGARIVLHLLHVMKRNNARRGVASICIGGGQGGAMLLEREEG